MTVKELKEKLQNAPDDTIVLIDNYDEIFSIATIEQESMVLFVRR